MDLLNSYNFVQKLKKTNNCTSFAGVNEEMKKYMQNTNESSCF